MDRWVGKVAVVTGASAGIGLETAKALVRNGMVVVGLARRVDKMETEMSLVKGPGKFYARSCDVTDENDVIKNFEWIEKNLHGVHVLVNNAGTLRQAKIIDLKTEDLYKIINVNIVGLLHCTRQALKIMKKSDSEGHIVNINSNAGHKVVNLGVPMNIYPATKHAVTALSQTLIGELDGSNIRVTSISPGVVKTEIFEVGNLDHEVMSKHAALNPEDVANSIIYVISAPLHVQITELTIKPLGQLF